MKPYLKLKHRWEEFNMNQKEAARAVGMSESTLSMRVNGKQPFSLWEIAAICKVLQIEQEKAFEYFPLIVPREKTVRISCTRQPANPKQTHAKT